MNCEVNQQTCFHMSVSLRIIAAASSNNNPQSLSPVDAFPLPLSRH